ncbi:MAG: sugar phosphate isomerase/epimerase family protein [Ginsengibacter sp.]
MTTTRRDFVIKSAMAAAGMAYSYRSFANTNSASLISTRFSGNELSKISIFSRAFREISYAEMIPIVAAIGFDGIDLTVRLKGHVLPENVKRDLPIVVDKAKKSGLNIYMIATDIIDADDHYTEPILETAASLGIKYYRMGRQFYDKTKSIAENLADFRKEFEKLEKLNRKYNIRGECQNHEGDGFGAPVWDLWEVLKNIDPQWTGVQYDLFHAAAEGANSWPLAFNLLQPHIGTLDMKDFYWKKADGKWDQEITPLGEGMVDFKKFFALLKDNNMHGPFSIHCEYLREKADLDYKAAMMKKDLATLRGWVNDAQL